MDIGYGMKNLSFGGGQRAGFIPIFISLQRDGIIGK
jgi:hypothetical protein